MSYNIYRTDGTLLTTIPDGVVNTVSTPLSLPGRNYSSYGVTMDTNFVHHLENFANATLPASAIRGQLWYNTTNNSLYLCPTDGETNINNWIKLLATNQANISTGNLTLTGNINANNASLTNQVDANSIRTNYLTVNVSANLATANVTGLATIANLLAANITSGSNTTAGNLTGNWTVNGQLNVPTGNLVTANILTDNYKWANGVAVSFGKAGGSENQIQLNVAGNLTGYPSLVFDHDASNLNVNANINAVNVVVTTGTFTGNASGISHIPAANIEGTLPLAVQGNITQVGSLIGLTVNGNINATGNISTTGRVSATTVSGTLTTAAQPNITSVGTLTSLAVTGNVSAGNLSGSLLTGTLTTTTQPNITSVGTLTSINVSGVSTLAANVNVGGNLAVAGKLTANSNVQFTGSNISLGAISNVKVTGGTSGYLIITDGTGNLSFVDPGSVGTKPSGTNTQVQYNDAGSLGGSAGFTFNKVSNALSVSGNLTVGNIAGANLIAANYLTGTLTTAAQPNITSVGSLTALTVNGSTNLIDVSASGNAAFNANLTVTKNVSFSGSNVSLGPISNIKVTGGTSGYIVVTDGSGNLSFVNPVSVGTKPAGTNTQIQYNDAGALGATTGFTFDKVAGNLSVPGSVSAVANISSNNLSVSNNVTVGANVSISNRLTASGNVQFTGSNVSLGTIGNVKVTGGTSGYVIVTDGSGNLTFANPGAIGTQPAGVNTQVQFNDSGALGATSAFAFNKTTNVLTVTGGFSTGSLTTTANAILNGNVTVANNTSLNANLTVANNASVNSNLTVGGNLAVNGAFANISGNVVVTKNVLVSGNLSVTGDIVGATVTGTHYGSGAGLTSLTGGNVVGSVASANISTRSSTVDVTNSTADTVYYITGVTAPGTGATLYETTGVTFNASTKALTSGSIVTGALTVSSNANFSTSTQTSRDVIEQVSISTAPGGTVQVNLIGAAITYYTSNSSGNWSFNFRGNSSVTTNSYLTVGQSVTTTILVTQGSTGYYPTAFSIDGSFVTPKWLGGAAPTAGDPNSVDAYMFTIVKTGASAYSVFASVSKYA